jgi:hypothetical protein
MPGKFLTNGLKGLREMCGTKGLTKDFEPARKLEAREFLPLPLTPCPFYLVTSPTPNIKASKDSNGLKPNSPLSKAFRE